ncbi:hypothetical protein [Ramlibacter montanisoli]|uniref:Uncharacterized protein n=1 Tax=Ramlibacter montanisoli TaxID=2732512 RepID=A0A849KGT3_9BURK|nr:hypothetical protein [Ramlibacter montanisoli]NNU43333.1 hypothetical protein [Ramlibacter montanisoli]
MSASVLASGVTPPGVSASMLLLMVLRVLASRLPIATRRAPPVGLEA